MTATPLSVSAATDPSLVRTSGAGLFDSQTGVAGNGVMEEATGIYINQLFIGAVKHSSDLELLLQSILENYHEEGIAVSFDETVETVQGLYAAGSIFSMETLRDILQGNDSETPFRYTVQEGDTLESVAELLHTDVETIESLNGELPSLTEGTSLQIINHEALLHVRAVKMELYTEAVPYATVVVPDTTQYTTYKEVTMEGQEGSQTCLDQVVYVDGQEVQRTNFSRVLVTPAWNEVAIIGTIVPPDGSVPGEASGTFQWPAPSISTISSGFGARWGVHHDGVDIANGNSYGQAVVAADAGVVTYVKYDSTGYGYHLEIDHGNGMSTLYAHTSEILVQAGEKVTKGQEIARIGNTGDSTGAHLHFEIHESGTAVDPLPYLEN